MHTEEWPTRRCTGPCDQGRKECLTPDACRTSPDWAEMLSNNAADEAGRIVVYVIGILLILAAAWWLA